MNAIIDVVGPDAINRLGWVLVHFLWQGAAVAVALLAALKVWVRCSAHARYVACYTSLVVSALLPAATWVWLTPRNPPATGHDAAIMTPPAPGAASPHSPAVAVWTEQRSTIDGSTPVRFNSLTPLIVAAWLIGVALLGAYRAGGWMYVQYLRRQGRTPEETSLHRQLDRLRCAMSVRRVVRILHCPRIDSPAVVGAFKPVILLPLACLLNLTPQQLEVILAHELAHIRRHDYLLNLIQTAIETLLFFHPAVWWMSRRIRTEREHAADDLALRVTGSNRAEYADALAALEELRTSPPPEPALAAQGGSLLARVRRVLGAPAQVSDRATWWPAAAVAMLAVSLVVSVLHTRASAHGESSSPPSGRTAVVECVDQNGQPVAGAEVYLIDWFTGSGKSELSDHGPAKTGADGVARFEGLPTASTLSGLITAYARTPGRLAGIAMNDPQFVGSGRPLDEPMRLEMRPAVSLRGRVTGPPRAALDQAQVQILALNNLQVREGRPSTGGHLFRESFLAAPQMVRDVFTYRVARDGSLTLTDIPDNAHVIFGVQAPGLARELVAARHSADRPVAFEIDLRPEGVIEGKVNAPADAPLNGMSIEARSHDTPTRVGYVVPFEALVRDDGSFRIDHLPDGAYSIRLDDVSDGWVAPIEATRVGYGEVRTGITIPLGRGQLVRGIVTDAQSDKPLASALIGADMVVGTESERVSNSAATSEDGRFELRVPPGRLRIAIVRYPRGYSRDEDNPQNSQVEITVSADAAPPELQFKVREGVRTPRDLTRLTEPRVKVSGRLIDAGGKPIPGVNILYRYVQRQADGRDRPSPFTIPKTGADGAYEFEVPISNIAHVVYVEEGPTTAAESQAFTPRDAAPVRVEDVVVTPRPVVSRISGVLVDRRGQPVSGAHVKLSLPRHTQTDRAGAFAFDLYDEKPVSVSVEANSFQRQSWNNIPPGTRDARFVLRPVNPRLPEWSEPPPLPDPAALVGKAAPKTGVTWVVRPDNAAQPRSPKRSDAKMTALLFVGACPDPDGYRRRIHAFAEACAGHNVEPVVIFSPRFHEAAVRGFFAGTNTPMWAGIDGWPEDDTPVGFPGATLMTYGSRDRRGQTIFVIDSDGLVRHESDTPAALAEFLKGH